MRTSLAVYSVCTFLFVTLSKSIADTKLPSDLLEYNSELLKNVKSYEFVKPYRLDGRVKRHASTKLSSGHLEDTTIVFPGRKKIFHLDLFLNKGLFSQEFEESYVSDDASELVEQIPHEHCFYHGTVRGEENSDVSLSTCDGIEGVVRTNDGTFHIHPLKDQNGQVLDDHVMFNANDVEEQPATCGHKSHKKSLDKEINHKHSNNFKTRARRSVESEIKYVELFIINDKAQYDKYRNRTGFRAKQLANHLDSIFRLRSIRIALVKLETWEERDLIVVDRNASKALNNFLEYKKKNLDQHKGKHFDNVQLITHVHFDGTTVGYAPIGSICGTGSASVVRDYSDSAAKTASIMAHELGHNFGMVHDESNCECPETNGSCVMSAFLSKAATKFSSCSLRDLQKTFKNGYGQCLFDEPKMLYGEAICGNGFVEEGEQCDCGTQEECKHFGNSCCNVTTCMLMPGVACSHGECCDNCQFKSKGTECRKKYNDCDLPEHCTGNHEMCPEDHHYHDGISCHNNDGYCFGGICRSLELQCQLIFGDDVTVAPDRCFNRNAGSLDNPFYHCRNDTHGAFPCSKEDVKCGRIHCLTTKAKFSPIRGQNRFYYYGKIGNNQWCISTKITWGDGRDPQYVEDGAKCAEGKMCYNGKCTHFDEVIPVSAYNKCPNNCSGNGICNNKGNCHCKPGYACPDCNEMGSDKGGSIDSGQGCEPASAKGGVNVAAAVLIPLFLLLLIGAGVLVYIKRRTIQDRLSHYKFVRRTTTHSKTPPARTSQSSGLHAGLISGPTPAAQPVGQSRPPPPSRPADNQYPASTSINNVPQRPAFVPAQPRNDYKSVPLYPPSAAPVAQETTKPRPSPPARPLLKSNLPRTPSAPPTSQNNKPRLPPSRPPPSYKSVPDIPTAEEASTTPPTERRPAPRPKPRAPPGSHQSVPEFPDDVPVPKPRNIAPRPGHQSVPLFDLPDDGGVVRPSAVKANQAKPSPPRKPRTHEVNDENRVDFRAGLKPVPKPWEKM